MQQQTSSQLVGGQRSGGDLRWLLRAITAEEVRGFAVLWQRQHDADQQQAIEAEREQLELEIAADNQELAQLQEKLAKMQAGEAATEAGL